MTSAAKKPLVFLLPALLGLALPLAATPLRAAAKNGRLRPLNPEERALHVLNRLGYGPRPGELRSLLDQGEEAWVESQLDPEALALPEDLTAARRTMPSLDLGPEELFRAYGPQALRDARPMSRR